VVPQFDAGLFRAPTASADQALYDRGHREAVEPVRKVRYGHDRVSSSAAVRNAAAENPVFQLMQSKRTDWGAAMVAGGVGGIGGLG
jgi:hypothetical protein